MTRVAVRIVPRDGGFLVIGRQTSVWCPTWPQAWAASIPYFAGLVR